MQAWRASTVDRRCPTPAHPPVGRAAPILTTATGFGHGARAPTAGRRCRRTPSGNGPVDELTSGAGSCLIAGWLLSDPLPPISHPSFWDWRHSPWAAAAMTSRAATRAPRPSRAPTSSSAPGPRPGTATYLTVHYIGSFLNGQVFQSSYTLGYPIHLHPRCRAGDLRLGPGDRGHASRRKAPTRHSSEPGLRLAAGAEAFLRTRRSSSTWSC